MSLKMCDWDSDIIVRLWIAADLSCDGKAKWKNVKIDSCIAQLVDALQKGGVNMRGSCCGHGKAKGHIDLQDGRILVLEDASWLANLEKT